NVRANHLVAVACDHVAGVQDVDVPPAPGDEDSAIAVAAVTNPADVRIAQGDENDARRRRVDRGSFADRDIDTVVGRAVSRPEPGHDRPIHGYGPPRRRYLPSGGAL